MSFGFSINWTTLSFLSISNTPYLVGSSASYDPIKEFEHSLDALMKLELPSGVDVEIKVW